MRLWDLDSTICAPCSGSGPAVVSKIRISGPDTVAVIDRTVRVSAGAERQSSRASRFEGLVDLGDDFGLCPVSVYLWPTDRSYTGQPAAEIQVIGCTPLVEMLCETLIRQGCRMAQPGEFTLRAFLAGRIDLTQAEAVLGVIDARGEEDLQGALHQLAGGLQSAFREVRTMLIEVLAQIEAGLDFVDEDIEFVTQREVHQRILSVRATLEEMLHGLVVRHRSEDLPRIVLVGAPNAGKSSLFNALLGRNVAIVDASEGTTRDFVSERFDCLGQSSMLIDTAGIFEELSQRDQPDVASQEHSLAQVGLADILIYCRDVSSSQRDLTSDRLKSFLEAGGTVLRIGTKRDLLKGQLQGLDLSHFDLLISSDSTEDLHRMKELLLAAILAERSREGTKAVASTAARSRECIERAIVALNAAADLIEQELRDNTAWTCDDLVAGEIRLALDELGQVAGEVYTDHLLDEIFSKFCIGK